MSNLAKRVASAAIMAPAALGAVVWLPAWGWPIAVALVAAVAAREIERLAAAVDTRNAGPVAPFGAFLVALLGSAATHDLACWPACGDGMLAGVAIVVVLAFAFQIARPPERRSVTAWAVAVAVPVYIGGLAAVLVRLRTLNDGVTWVILALVLVWVNDSAAYFGGRAFGRTPMAPALSPKKTWEGLAVGTVATVAVAATAAWVALPAMFPTMWELELAGANWLPSTVSVAALGLAVSIAGPFGDLSHSFIKRQFGAKDSSHLIPGHGGIWDRIDSLLFAAPVVYLFARLLGA